MLLGRSTGGIGTDVAQLSADLRERGVNVMVVTHPLTAEHFDLGPVQLCWPGSAGMVHALRDFRALRRLAVTADIVHAHGHQSGLLATFCTLRLPGGPKPRTPKLVVSQHNAVLEGSGRQLLKRLSQRWVARRADLVTGASSDLVKEALASGACRAELAEVPSPRVPELLAQQPAVAATRVRIRQIVRTRGNSGSPRSVPVEESRLCLIPALAAASAGGCASRCGTRGDGTSASSARLAPSASSSSTRSLLAPVIRSA